MYADTDFFLALLKEDDWLGERAEEILDEHRGDIETSFPTLIELFFLSEDYEMNLERSVSNILEIADIDIEEDVIFRAAESLESGLNTIDAFQKALAGEAIISSDKEFDEHNIDRIRLERK